MKLFSRVFNTSTVKRRLSPLIVGVLTSLLLLTGISFAVAEYLGPNRTVVTSTTWTRKRCDQVYFRVLMPSSECVKYGLSCPAGFNHGFSYDDWVGPNDACPVHTNQESFAWFQSIYGFSLPANCLTNTNSSTQVVCYWTPITRTAANPTVGVCTEGQTSCTRTDTTTTYAPATVSGAGSCSVSGLNGWCKGVVALNLSSTEPVAGHSITKIESTLGDLCPSSGACKFIFPEGVTSLSYWAVSTFGDTSAQKTASTKVDSVPPTADLSVSGTLNNGWYNANNPIVFTAVGADTTSGVASLQIQVDSETPVASPLTFTREGEFSVSSIVSDNAGNQTNSGPTTVKIDRTAPSVSILADTTPSDIYFLGETTISAIGSDALSGYDRTDYSLTDADGVVSSGTLPVTISAEGTNDIDLISYDAAGNSTPNTRSYTLDLTPPVVSPLSSGTSGTNGWFVSSVSLDVDASDTVSGICSTSVAVNGSPDWEIGPVTLSNEGINTFSVRAFDCAGRYSLSDSTTVKIDTSNPSFAPTIQGTAGENDWYTSSVIVRAHASDATSGVASVSPSPEITFSADGIHPAPSFTAVDEAGNTASTTLASEIKVDRTPPTIVIDDLPDTFFGTVTLTGTAIDPTSGLNSLELSLNSGLTWTPLAVETDGTWSQAGVTFVLMGDNPLAIVRAKDNAGNVATATVDPDALPTPTFTATAPSTSIPPQPTSTPTATATFIPPTWTPTATLTATPSATATTQPTATLMATIASDSESSGTLSASLGNTDGTSSSNPSGDSSGDSSGDPLLDDPDQVEDSPRSETIFFGLIPVTAGVKDAVEAAVPVAATTVAVTAAIGGAVALGSPAAAAFRPEWLSSAYSSLSLIFFTLFPIRRREEKDGENDESLSDRENRRE